MNRYKIALGKKPPKDSPPRKKPRKIRRKKVPVDEINVAPQQEPLTLIHSPYTIRYAQREIEREPPGNEEIFDRWTRE